MILFGNNFACTFHLTFLVSNITGQNVTAARLQTAECDREFLIIRDLAWLGGEEGRDLARQKFAKGGSLFFNKAANHLL